MTSARRLPDRVSEWVRLLTTAARHALKRFRDSEDFTYASAIAYYALLSLFPLLLIAVWALGRLTDSPADRAAVADLVLRFFPQQVDLVSSQLESIGTAGLGFGVAGTAVIVWVSLGVFRVTSQAVNHAWGVEEPPGFLRHQLVAFAMLLAAGAFLLLALAWVTVVGMARSSWFERVLEIMPALDAAQRLSSRSPATVVLIVVVASVHYFVPATTVRLRDVWPGALMTGLMWQGALSVFSWYLGEMANLSVRGSIAAVVTFLIWVYISAAIFLYGVEFTAAWVRLREREYS